MLHHVRVEKLLGSVYNLKQAQRPTLGVTVRVSAEDGMKIPPGVGSLLDKIPIFGGSRPIGVFLLSPRFALQTDILTTHPDGVLLWNVLAGALRAGSLAPAGEPGSPTLPLGCRNARISCLLPPRRYKQDAFRVLGLLLVEATPAFSTRCHTPRT